MSTDQTIHLQVEERGDKAGEPVDSKIDIKTALVGAIIAVLVMVPVTYKMMEHSQQKVEDRLANAPPVAILDFTNAVATYAQTGGNEMDLERMVRGVDTTVRKLSGAGFLVLDAKAVLSAPKTLYVPQSMILGVDEGSPVTQALSANSPEAQTESGPLTWDKSLTQPQQ